MTVLGIDIGAGAVKYGVFPASPPSGGRRSWAPLFTAEEKTPGSAPDLKAQVLRIIAAMENGHRVKAVGIGVPGFISRKNGVIERSPNMRFLDGMALERELAAASPLPLRVENDANAAAFGEFLALDEPRPDPFVHLTLGSGIGAGIVLGGRLYLGACGFAGELGHLPVNSQGRPCGCGNRGCAETESSEAGIIASFREAAGSGSPLASRDVFALWRQGDEAARRAFARAGRYLGVLLAQIVYSFNPARIAIGGGVAAAGEALLGPAREELERRVIAAARACTHISPARLGNAAGMAGAAAVAAAAGTRVRQRRPGGSAEP